MDLYSILKLLHIASAMLWAGGLAGLLMLQAGEARSGPAGLLASARRTARFARVIVGPAAVGSLLFGGALVYMAWSVLDLWIAMALSGFLATFVVDAFLVGRLERLLPDADAAPSPEAMAVAGRILNAARFDALVLFSILALMVLKPGTQDAALAAAVATVVLAGGVLLLRPRRAVPG